MPDETLLRLADQKKLSDPKVLAAQVRRMIQDPRAWVFIEQFAEQWRRMPLGRGTTPEEIARAVDFILSSPAMTGQMIALDGGQHLGWAVPQPRRKEPEE